MKMAKKLLALVLTGVMAVSMLTGCALSDRAAANALEKALNGNNTQPTQKVVYNYDKDLNSKQIRLLILWVAMMLLVRMR